MTNYQPPSTLLKTKGGKVELLVLLVIGIQIWPARHMAALSVPNL
jgi:hypothetical protein